MICHTCARHMWYICKKTHANTMRWCNAAATSIPVHALWKSLHVVQNVLAKSKYHLRASLKHQVSPQWWQHCQCLAEKRWRPSWHWKQLSSVSHCIQLANWTCWPSNDKVLTGSKTQKLRDAERCRESCRNASPSAGYPESLLGRADAMWRLRLNMVCILAKDGKIAKQDQSKVF